MKGLFNIPPCSYISMGEVARRANVKYEMMRHYNCGTKKPSAKRKKSIVKAINELGKELSRIKIIPHKP